MLENRILNEIKHGEKKSKKNGTEWYWDTPAGKLRELRRINLFNNYLKHSKNILEIGCGHGRFTEAIAVDDRNVTAIDISPDLINIAKANIRNRKIQFITDNAYHSSLPDHSFDAIVGNSVLHHLDVQLALKEFKRLLLPGGVLIFSEPNMLNPQIAIQKNIPFFKKLAGDSPDETAFFKWELSNIFQRHGFNNICITPYDFMHPKIPGYLAHRIQSACLFIERIPLIKEVAGSLMISATIN